MAFCPTCGTNVPDGTQFCPSCGTRISPNYQQQPYGQPQPPAYRAPGGYRANIQKRDPIVAIILSLVTCGIYGLIWFFNIVTDLNSAAQTPDDKTPGTVLLLSIVTCGIYGIIWLYHAGEKVDRIRQMNGELPNNSSVMYLILSLVGLSVVTYYLIQTELNKVAIDA